MTSPIETNNVVERRKGQLTVLLAMVEADIQRTSETESFMVRAGLLRDIILENQSLSDRIDVLAGLLREARQHVRTVDGIVEVKIDVTLASLTQGGKSA